MKKNLLITVRPGVGKTTLVMKVIEVSGLNARGFYTREIRIGGDRKGFKVRRGCDKRIRQWIHSGDKGPGGRQALSSYNG